MQINRVLHTMAVVRLRYPTEGRGCYERKKVNDGSAIAGRRRELSRGCGHIDVEPSLRPT